MKKLLVAMLSLLLVFTFTSCGDTKSADDTALKTDADGVLSVHMCDDLEFTFEGAAYADCEYNVIDTPEWLVYDEALSETVYYAEGADIPYIVIAHWPADDATLEEAAEYVAKEYSTNGFYDTFEYNGYTFANIFTDSQSYGQPTDDSYYYVEDMFVIDGEEEVSLDLYYATEEVALGESGKYMWVPVGYKNHLSAEDMSAHNVYFSNEYDKSYYMPTLFASADTSGNYEEETWAWSHYYPDGLPFDEATFNNWSKAGWDEASCDAYYEALGLNVTYNAKKEIDGCSISFYTGDITEADGTECSIVDAYLLVDDLYYNIFVSTDLDPAPAYFNALINSIHSK